MLNMDNEESSLMQFLRKTGLTRTAWSLRRVHCPVPSQALVLEVGSGGNPYFRANVLLDAYEDTQQRHWVPLVADRPTVLGTVERLPFRDKCFDFVIASHVLEHSSHPEHFLAELQRVGKSGYIEVPDALMERLNPYRDHRLEITLRNRQLVIRKKPAWRTDPELTELFEHRAKRWIAGETIPRHPFDFHVRYYWNGTIDYVILNPEVDASWDVPAGHVPVKRNPSWRARINAKVLKYMRQLLSQHRRNASLRLENLLACPQCRSIELTVTKEIITCRGCLREYPVRNGLPNMFAKSGSH
jgi:antitoxin component of MazEF toxin-antitoxin module